MRARRHFDPETRVGHCCGCGTDGPLFKIPALFRYRCGECYEKEMGHPHRLDPRPLSYRTRKSACPCCHRTLDGATKIHGENTAPAAGTLSVCFYCGSFLIFTEDLSMRLMTLEEVGALPDEVRNLLVRARNVAKEVNP